MMRRTRVLFTKLFTHLHPGNIFFYPHFVFNCLTRIEIIISGASSTYRHRVLSSTWWPNIRRLNIPHAEKIGLETYAESAICSFLHLLPQKLFEPQKCSYRSLVSTRHVPWFNRKEKLQQFWRDLHSFKWVFAPLDLPVHILPGLLTLLASGSYKIDLLVFCCFAQWYIFSARDCRWPQTRALSFKKLCFSFRN